MDYIDETRYVGSDGHKYMYTHVVCFYRMHIFNTSLAFLFWLANNKKIKYTEFCMGYCDKTWYVSSDGHKYYPRGLSSPNVHIWYLIYMSVLIAYNKKKSNIISRALLDTSPKAGHAVYSVNIASA